jgi:energy-coupling factor transporter ATP-binding protein EcfA2
LFEEQNICPYTGLRSFTEEESLYFKGRDEHIEQASEMLGKNKFLMLTGASGDGKSSLVYAGIIPNARAGFIKSHYTNWQIADFRPERSPFENLCNAISKALDIPNVATVQSELQHGFSALVDLYKSSSLYMDKNSEDYHLLSPEDQKGMQYKNANLIILADQFEEFFTNPENYLRGIPSVEANLTLNLLLETAKIAHRDNLPIYIVFTMRSDYIGQCSAFRDLPEYIGFSQFFVPRLNRKELQEVIEEPAVLSGNQISRRLTERLIHDITEGVDQLPILQHALNQIWKAADEGKDEMDLLHYAKVGGMAVKELPSEDQELFSNWFQTLHANIQNCFHTPSLQNVLDTHANKIYESAAFYAKQNADISISHEDAHLIIKTTFTCLTKIDHSRAVRNRMTLEEIVEILNKPGIDIKVAAEVLNNFREPGNTFIHPFINESDQESRNIDQNTVLDITHESLIRNWQMLKDWADEEYGKFTTFADFKQQVDRWIEHENSWGFLLPIGALTFFEDWYSQTNPNKYWVNRYNEHVTETKKNLDESTEIVKNSEFFLRQSGRKHAITRAVMRFGPRKIAAGLAIILVLAFSSFAVYNNIKKKNFYVIQQIESEGIELLNKGRGGMFPRSFYLVVRERNEPGMARKILNEIEDPLNAFELATAMAVDLNLNGPQSDLELFNQSIYYADSMATLLNDKRNGRMEDSRYMHGLIELVDIADWSYFYRQDAGISEIANRNAKRLGQLVIQFLNKPWADINIKEVNESLEIALNHHGFSSEEINGLINLLSPLEDHQMVGLITPFYTRDKTLDIGAIQDKISFNGLYLQLAGLYAYDGDLDKVMQSTDTLLKYHPNIDNWSTNPYNIAGYFVLNGFWVELDAFASYYASRQGIKKYQAYRRILDRTGKHNRSSHERFDYQFFGSNMWGNPILNCLNEEQIAELYEQYLQSILKISDEDELNFNLAIYHKQRGVDIAKRYQDRLISNWKEISYAHFDISWEAYQKVSASYLNEEIRTFFRTPQTTARRNIYLFPDYREIFEHMEPRSRFARYHTGAYLEYILDRNLFSEMFESQSDLELVTAWVNEYKTAIKPVVTFWYGANKVDTKVFESLYGKLSEHPEYQNINDNLLKIILSNRLFKEDRAAEALEIVKRIDPVSFPEILVDEFNWNVMKTFQNIGELYTNLVLMNEYSHASRWMTGFPDEKNKARLYDMAAVAAYTAGNKDLGNLYLDSANQTVLMVRNAGNGFMNYRREHAKATAMAGGPQAISNSKEIVSSLNNFMRYDITYRIMVRGVSFNGQYYDANMARPQFASTEEKLMTINQILYSQEYFKKNEEWAQYDYVRDSPFNFVGYDF